MLRLRELALSKVSKLIMWIPLLEIPIPPKIPLIRYPKLIPVIVCTLHYTQLEPEIYWVSLLQGCPYYIKQWSSWVHVSYLDVQLLSISTSQCMKDLKQACHSVDSSQHLWDQTIAFHTLLKRTRLTTKNISHHQWDPMPLFLTVSRKSPSLPMNHTIS